MARKRHILARTTLLLFLALSASAQNRYIVHVVPGKINSVAGQYGLSVVNQLGGSSSNLYLVSPPPYADASWLMGTLSQDPSIQSVEFDQQITLPKKSNILNQPASGQFMVTQDWATVFSPAAWQGYLDQPAATTISLAGAHQYATGAGVVAFLDTGVDFSSPVLIYSLMQGADFTTAAGGNGQDSPSVTQSTTSILDDDSMIQLNQSTTSILDYTGGGCDPNLGCLNQSTTSILDQSTTSILDNGTAILNAYGHGTMIAGLIHLVAPTAWLLPVRVFGTDGTAPLSTLLNGIYYAINHGAKVINMSFSMTAPSGALQTALQAASQAGIICVAAVGNDGEQALVYPAAYPQVIGVASTNNQDLRSSFSNYGPIVTVAAPGEELISTYPGNRYAAGWGTSFSAPLVSGAVALLMQLNWGLNPQSAKQAISQADPLAGQGLGAGELDVVKALQSLIYSSWGWGQ
jgi:subtilisin family serine protease